jgi:tetratricopeptide (TPR) repeat protein
MLSYYNYLRFDSVTEFGLKYIINDNTYKTSVSSIIYGIKDFVAMPPHFHENYPYITLLWDWNLPQDWKNIFWYLGSPCLGILWICPVIAFLPIILFNRNRVGLILPVLMGFFVTGAMILMAVASVSREGRYVADFISYLIIPSIIATLILINGKQKLINFGIEATALGGVFLSTLIAFAVSRPATQKFKGDEGILEDKISHFELSKEANPEKASGYFVLGAFYSQKGDFDMALLNYVRCSEIDPSYREVSDRILKTIQIRKELGLDLKINSNFETGKTSGL